MKVLIVLLILSGCAGMVDNTNKTDKFIIGSSLLAFTLFAQGAKN
jgi:uncharacterized protein YceK